MTSSLPPVLTNYSPPSSRHWEDVVIAASSVTNIGKTFELWPSMYKSKHCYPRPFQADTIQGTRMRKSCHYQGANLLIVATMFAEYLAFSYELIESFSGLIRVKAVYLPRYINIGA